MYEAGRRWAEEAPNRELLDCRHLGTARTNGVGDAAAWRMGVQVVVAAMVAEEPRRKSVVLERTPQLHSGEIYVYSYV